ncbi:hypothetical protein GCM10009551_090540 [Nocardiopsis tropica]|uniref:MspA family porin n=1 Tax=Tsukamurella strandjordii TaxID=147577 RepID=UPI0033815006
MTPQNLQISGTATNTVNGSITPSLSGTVGGSGTGGSSGGSGTVNASVTPSISATAGDSLATGMTISGSLAPGTAKDFPIAKKSLEGTSGYVTTRETRAAVDGALGGVQVRMYATASISTQLGDSSTTTYGKPIFIERDNPDPARTPPTVTVTEDRNPVDPRQAVAKPVTAPVAPPKPGVPAAGKSGPPAGR